MHIEMGVGLVLTGRVDGAVAVGGSPRDHQKSQWGRYQAPTILNSLSPKKVATPQRPSVRGGRLGQRSGLAYGGGCSVGTLRLAANYNVGSRTV